NISYTDLIMIAQEYEVSSVALLWRMCNIGWLRNEQVFKILEDAEFQQLNNNLRVNDYEDEELPARYVTLCYTGYQNGKISKAKLAELLGVSLSDLSKRLKEYGFADEPATPSSMLTLRR
ncbi:hypothetical protein ACFLUJ_06800, partial [Chloroflexota bacterium]